MTAGKSVPTGNIHLKISLTASTTSLPHHHHSTTPTTHFSFAPTSRQLTTFQMLENTATASSNGSQQLQQSAPFPSSSVTSQQQPRRRQQNVYRNMHGGAVGAVAERVSIACARTVVGKDKELFLGELKMSYLSAALTNAEVVVEGSIIRSGRNITVVAVDFRLKDSRKLVYTSNATFYHMPVASL